MTSLHQFFMRACGHETEFECGAATTGYWRFRVGKSVTAAMADEDWAKALGEQERQITAQVSGSAWDMLEYRAFSVVSRASLHFQGEYVYNNSYCACNGLSGRPTHFSGILHNGV